MKKLAILICFVLLFFDFTFLINASVEIVEQKDNILSVRGLDAIEGTPVMDIKPYIKKLDVKTDAISGWIEKTNLERDYL